MTRLNHILLHIILWSIATIARGDTAFLTAPLTAPKISGIFRTPSLSIVNGPYTIYAGTQLVVRPDGGSVADERILVDKGAIDFSVSRDARSLLATIDWNIYRIDLATGEKTQLTSGLGKCCQAVECSDGIVFLTNVDGWKSPKANYPAFVLYRMDRDGKNVERLWHAGIGGVFGLHVGPDDRIYFSTGENQGLKTGAANGWPIWSINSDGSDFRPETSPFFRRQGIDGPPFDWPCISTDGSLVAAVYYNTRVYGRLDVSPVIQAEPHMTDGKFLNPLWKKNPPIRNGHLASGASVTPLYSYYGFMRNGEFNPIPEMTDADYQNKNPQGQLPGMVSHPSPIPGNGALLSWTGDQGDANMNLGVYKLPDVRKVYESYKEMAKVVDEPDRHEWFGRQLVPFKDIYGKDAPPPSRGVRDESLPDGSPFCTVGSASVNINELIISGTEAPDNQMIVIDEEKVDYIRILAMAPTKNVAAGALGLANLNNGSPWDERLVTWEGLYSEPNERMGWYVGDVPVKKYRTPDGKLHVGPNPPAGSVRLKRADGRYDTSFRVQIPANQPWSFQLLNAKKEVIPGSTAQTWHQGISAEKRVDCQGCHAHWRPDAVAFADTLAASDEYPVNRLTAIKTAVFERDIEPLGLGIPQRPWDTTDKTKLHRSFENTLTAGKDWTPEQIALVSAWQGTGMMAAGKKNDGSVLKPESKLGPYLWTMPPTLVVTKDAKWIGAHSPVGSVKLSVLADSVDVTDKLVANEAEKVWRVPVAATYLTVTATDDFGNVSKIMRTPASPLPPDPEPTPTPKAQFAGFEDVMGKLRGHDPDGQPDLKFTLTNLQKRKISYVVVRAGSPETGDDFKWSDRAGEESQQNPAGNYWMLEYSPALSQTGSGSLDVWLSQPSYAKQYTDVRIYVYYSEDLNDRDFLRATAVTMPEPPPVDDVAKLKARIAELEKIMTDNKSTLAAAVAAFLKSLEALK